MAVVRKYLMCVNYGHHNKVLNTVEDYSLQNAPSFTALMNAVSHAHNQYKSIADPGLYTIGSRAFVYIFSVREGPVTIFKKI